MYILFQDSFEISWLDLQKIVKLKKVNSSNFSNVDTRSFSN